HQFADLMRNRTAEDGSDLGMWIGRLFSILDAEEDDRTTTLDEDLAAFPYVNGGLYQEPIDPPDTTRGMRDRLLEASAFDWSKISPAVFGSMFQSVMDPEARRHLGAHYTSEANIFKVIRPLFLDGLETELAAAGTPARLRAFHRKLGELQFLDPACGCGNFLVIAYRELRRLERETLLKLYPQNVQMTTELEAWRHVSLDQFCGIEIEEFPVRIAETAIYLVDHLENEKLGASFGVNIADLPLAESAEIRWANALETPWADVLDPGECSFLLGNPPYGGKHLLDDAQKGSLAAVFEDHPQGGTMDFVSGWFKLAADYLAAGDGTARGAFVATNSVTQGEQVPALWPTLHQAGLHIDFAWRTFDWTSEGRHRAHVHVVIIGFVHSGEPVAGKIYEFDAETDTSVAHDASTINGYLVAFDETYPAARTTPLADVLPVAYGSKPTDQGNLLLNAEEAAEVRGSDSVAARYIRPLLSTDEFLDGIERFCFWLEDADPADIRESPTLRTRIAAVKTFREASKKAQTRDKAKEPGVFAEIRTPENDFVFVPLHSSGDRRLIPMGFVPAADNAIVHNSGSYVENADLALFGLLQSEMFSAWQRVVGGRIKSDYRFNNRLVYNTFPFPDLSDLHRDRIGEAASGVLGARDAHDGSSLADLYDPLATPRDLVAAHRDLDGAVDLAFGRRRRPGEAERMAFLFDEHMRVLEAGQLQATPTRRRRRR
ncbi:MAG TPA: DNA methyltransferase, partial [Solirubrobacterales bacterium]